MDMINVFKKGLPIFDLFDELGEEPRISDIDLAFNHTDINLELLNFLQYEVLPDYVRNVDKSHSVEHILDVVKNSLTITEKLKENKDIAITAAIYHDIGRVYDMDFNKNFLLSFSTIINDSDLLLDCGLLEDEILSASDAIVELSPSSDKTNIYSKILSDADKISEIINPDYIIKRYCNYVISHYTYEPLDKLIDRLYTIIHNRYKAGNIGPIYYTDIGKQIYEKNIKSVLKITNDKKVFLNRLAKLVEKENKKARG